CSKDEIKKYKRINLRNLRSRFGSLIMEAELGYRQIEYMMGHVLPAVQGAYFKLPSEDVMRRAYLKALPHLMIFESIETKVLTDERLKEYEERDKQKDKVIKEMMERLDALERDKERKEWLEEIK
ncbi:MAG: hypothetical protein ABFC57_19000, partial [Veillonellales bacterium]